jgi:hypothetical protein
MGSCLVCCSGLKGGRNSCCDAQKKGASTKWSFIHEKFFFHKKTWVYLALGDWLLVGQKPVEFERLHQQTMERSTVHDF